ncbi:MAG TPA: hypothetical protein PKD53_27780 [Chloroflexaceae bacterium]|nr:hypothetical protein [Chloroflexaceae bacterium]
MPLRSRRSLRMTAVRLALTAATNGRSLRPPEPSRDQGDKELQHSEQAKGPAEEHRGRDERLGDLGEGKRSAEHSPTHAHEWLAAARLAHKVDGSGEHEQPGDRIETRAVRADIGDKNEQREQGKPERCDAAPDQ